MDLDLLWRVVTVVRSLIEMAGLRSPFLATPEGRDSLVRSVIVYSVNSPDQLLSLYVVDDRLHTLTW